MTRNETAWASKLNIHKKIILIFHERHFSTANTIFDSFYFLVLVFSRHSLCAWIKIPSEKLSTIKRLVTIKKIYCLHCAWLWLASDRLSAICTVLFATFFIFCFGIRNHSPNRIDGQMRRNFALSERERILLHHVSSVSSRVFPHKTFGDVRRHFIYALYILFLRFFFFSFCWAFLRWRC